MSHRFEDQGPPELKELAERFIKPGALAVAIAQCVREYADAVASGRMTAPAHRRPSPSVEMVWTDVRIEAFSQMFCFGQCDLMLLADFRRQSELLAAFIDKGLQLALPQPLGEPVADTLQGVFQLYSYLDAVGSELADPATDRDVLKTRGRDILSVFAEQAGQLRGLWEALERAVRTFGAPIPDMPCTLMDVLWQDVTAKTKSIALSRVFGPLHDEGMSYLLSAMTQHGGTEHDVQLTRIGLERVRAAREPEEIRAAARQQ